jgi:hypothetical protein
MMHFAVLKIAVTVGLLVAVGCTGDDASAPMLQPVKATETPSPTATAIPTAIPTATPPPTPVGPSGSVMYAVPGMQSLYSFYRYVHPSEVREPRGVEEYLFVMGEDGDPMSPQLAKTWEVYPEGIKVTIEIESGIPWHAPTGQEDLDAQFGDLVAEDLVAWINSTNSNTNIESTVPMLAISL